MASSQSFSMIQRRISLSPPPASPVKSGEPLKTMARRLPPSLRVAHLGEHVLEKEKRAVVHARRARAEASREAQRSRSFSMTRLLLFPLHAEGRIGEHVIELLRRAVEAILREGVAEDDVVGVLALDEHVGFADGPGFVVPVLAEQLRLGVGVEVANVFLGDGQHAARAAGRIVNRLDDVARA